MSDFALETRRAILTRMKSDGQIASLLAGVYGGTVPAKPTFPFGRVNPPITTPFRATGLDSAQFRITIQGFTQGVTVDGALTVSAEDNAYQIGSAFKDGLDGRTLALEGGGKLRLTWAQTIAMIDGDEPSAWMVTTIFTGDVSG